MNKAVLQNAIKQAQDNFADVIRDMPDKAVTQGQKLLKRKHGTPREFAVAVVAAIGEISVLEAGVAIREYLNKWEKS